MSFFRLFLPLLAIFSAFLYFALLNPGTADFSWARGHAAPVPLIALLMGAFFLGAVAMAAVDFFKGVGDLLGELGEGLRRMKGRRIEETFLKARRSAQQGMLARALDTLEKVLAERPRHYEALLLKGVLLRQAGRPAEALGAHSLALSVKPDSREAVLAIHDDYAAVGDWDATHRLLEEARERLPGDLTVLAALRDVNVARRDHRRALLAHKELLAAAPEDERPGLQVKMAELYLVYGEQLMAEGKPELAREQFAAAAALEPDFLAARLLLAEALIALQLRGEAEDLLMKEFRRTHSLAPLLRLDAMVQVGGGPQQGLDLMKRAAEMAPEEPLLPLFVLMGEIANRLYASARNRLETLPPAVAALPLCKVAKGYLELSAAAAPDPSAFAALRQALEAEWSAFMKYRCEACGAAQEYYFPQCPGCGAWDAAVFHLEGRISAASK